MFSYDQAARAKNINIRNWCPFLTLLWTTMILSGCPREDAGRAAAEPMANADVREIGAQGEENPDMGMGASAADENDGGEMPPPDEPDQRTTQACHERCLAAGVDAAACRERCAAMNDTGEDSTMPDACTEGCREQDRRVSQ